MTEQEMRITALGFAISMYLNENGDKGDATAEGFVSFANQVYKYIKEGTCNDTSN